MPPLLDLVERRRGVDDDRYSWIPFEPSARFTAGWWEDPPYLDDDPWFVQVLLQGVEVARVELGADFDVTHYAGAPRLKSDALEIEFFEVAENRRGHGLGTNIIKKLCAAHPNQQFVALSEGADGFWASLGWRRYDYRSGTALYRPLFVQPALLPRECADPRRS